MMKGIFNLASINRCRKMWICRHQVMSMVDKSFEIGRKRSEKNAVHKIQRILRGHMERNGKQELILEAVTRKVELKQHVSAKKIQKYMKGLIVRRSI